MKYSHKYTVKCKRFGIQVNVHLTCISCCFSYTFLFQLIKFQLYNDLDQVWGYIHISGITGTCGQEAGIEVEDVECSFINGCGCGYQSDSSRQGLRFDSQPYTPTTDTGKGLKRRKGHFLAAVCGPFALGHEKCEIYSLSEKFVFKYFIYIRWTMCLHNLIISHGNKQAYCNVLLCRYFRNPIWQNVTSKAVDCRSVTRQSGDESEECVHCWDNAVCVLAQ